MIIFVKNNTVSLLLSIYNGEEYLEELIDSLKKQTYSRVEIVARDDDSNDLSVKIAKKFDINLLEGKNRGVKKSFELLLDYALENSTSNYFMFCDQDDVWDSDKVAKSMRLMKMMEEKYGDTPLLVHSDLEVVDKNLKKVCNSFWKYEKIDPEKNAFHELLLQNTVTGCTLLINRKLAKLSLPIAKNAIMHDWWIALVASCFGEIGVLQTQTLKYRQHQNNVLGAKKFNLNLYIKKYGQKNILRKNFLQARAFLEQYSTNMDVKELSLLKKFISLQDENFYKRRVTLAKEKFYKHGVLRNLGLFLKI